MAPTTKLRGVVLAPSLIHLRTGEVARDTHATWRHRHIGPKSAPGHRDFGPGKEGVS